MRETSNPVLLTPLTPDETRWAMELTDKLPADADLTFEEAKILTRMPIDSWPKELLDKVRGVIDFQDFLTGSYEE